MRRRPLLLGVGSLALLVAVAAWTWLLVPPRPGVTQANYERVREGMTVAEVHAILGPPSYCPVRAVHVWERPEAFIVVLFDPHSEWRVRAKNADWSEPSVWDRLRRLLGF